MEYKNLSFFNGSSARSIPARVLLVADKIDVYSEEDGALINSFPFSSIHYNNVGDNFYIYLNKAGFEYIKADSDHPLAKDLPSMSGRGKSLDQRLVKQKPAVLVLIVLLLVFGVYLAAINIIPFFGMRVIGAETEIRIGNSLREVLLKEGRALGASVDTAGTQNLQAFADQLNLSNRYPIRLTLVKSKMVNAFALPGGHIVVYEGLLKRITKPEQLAALLAHEATHVHERHTLRSLLRKASLGIMVSVFLGDASGISAMLVSNAASLEGLRYSRALEKEADQKGMELLVKNKVDTRGMLELLKTLQQEGDIPESFSFFSSHPLTKERIKAAETFIKKNPLPNKNRTDLDASFEMLQQ